MNLRAASLSMVLAIVGCGNAPSEVATSFGDLTATSVVEGASLRSTLVDRTGKMLATLTLSQDPQHGVWTNSDGLSWELNFLPASAEPSTAGSNRIDMSSWPTTAEEANALVHTLDSTLSKRERAYMADGCSSWNTGSQLCMECHGDGWACFACEDGYRHCGNW